MKPSAPNTNRASTVVGLFDAKNKEKTMAPTIKQQLVNRKDRVFGFNNPCTYITVHETDNYSRGAGAQAHATFQGNGGGGASWHYQVDDKAIIQSYSDSAQCFHAGDGQGSGNLKSIAIETCVNPDANWATTKANLSYLIGVLMGRHKIPLSRVVQHNRWSGKNCPTIMRRNGNAQYNAMIASIGKTTAPTPSTPTPAPGKPATGTKSLDTVAREVVDGKWGNGQDRLQKLANAGYNYIEVQNRVNALLGAGAVKVPAAAATAKTVTQLANEVIAGKHGNGDARKKSLGSQHAAVQAEVNRILTGGKPVASGAAKKSNEQLANEVIYGLWGNGADRQKRLTAAGYNPAAVQAIVNSKLR